MKRAFVVCILLSTLFISSLLSVASVVIFGPQRFNRTTGAPNEYTVQFALPAGVTSPYTMHVVNGAPNGSNRVSSATIKLNGSQILGPSNFNQKVGVIDRTVTLIANNVLYVKLASKPGSYLTININGQGGITIPVLSITQPTDGSITKTSPVSVVGTVSGTTPITVTANGSPMTVNTNGVVNGQVALVEGINNINFTATDATGGSSTLVRRVTLDSHPPIVNLTSPIDNLITNQTSVAVIGTVTDSQPQADPPLAGTTVTVKVNGTNVPVSNGSFSISIALVEGFNTITVVATDAAGNQTTVTRKIRKDTQSPIVNLTSPIDSLLTNQLSITVSGTVKDSTAVTLTINGNIVLVGTDGTFSHQLTLIEGKNMITVVATDAAGNQTTVVRTVKRDTKSPTINLASPIDSLITNQLNVTVSGTVIDSTAATLTINGTNVPIGADGVFSYQLSVVEGINTIIVAATDATGNSTNVNRIVILDSTPPVLTITSPADGSTTSENTILVNGTVTDQSNMALSINGTVVSVNTDGSFTTTVSLIAGSNTITITATDALGQTTTIVRTVIREGEQLPPDPATVAPPIDQTVVTTVATATEFLYTGSNPIQTGVAPETIDPIRVAVIRGKVLNRDLTALSGVKIAVLGHPEFGQTLSRLDGVFDLAVNGGGYLTIKYEKDGFISAQRKIDAPWSDYVVMDSVILIQLDTVISTIDFSDTIQTARGSVVTDERGERQATMFFEQGTTATMVLANGDSVALPSVTVRATEFTVGENGTSAMPAELPATSGYTYCVDLSVDEALQADAKSVVFSKPVPFYIDNFLGFPVGLAVPTAYYDKESGVWVPVDDGRVIKVLGTTNGLAEIDADGDNSADQPDSLLILGIDSTERQKISSVYTAGQSLWRVEVTHFSWYDCNYGIIPDGDAEDPDQEEPEDEDPDDPCATGGSIIGIQNQTLGEQLPISGTPFALRYNSNRVIGRKDNNSLTIPLTSSTPPANVKMIELIISIAGRKFSQTYSSPLPNLQYTFVWDGKNSYGQALQGQQNVFVTINYYYRAYYQKPQSLSRTFAKASGFSTYIPAPDIIKSQRYRKTMGVLDNNSFGLGGWNLDIRHVYDVNTATIYFGDGTKRSVSNNGRVIRTIAGSDDYGFAGDGGSAKDALLDGPMGLAVGNDGSIYFADSYNNRVRRIGTDGIITTVAGSGEGGGGVSAAASLMSTPSSNIGPGDGGPAIEATLEGLSDVALGNDGSLYITESWASRIRRVRPDGIIETIAGTGNYGFSGDNGPAIEAELGWPTSIVVSPDGSIYFSDIDCSRVRKISTDGIISTVAGDGEWTNSGTDGNGGPATQASLLYPHGLAIGPDGSLYIVDDCWVKRVTPDGIITNFAGSGPLGWSSENIIPDERGDGGSATEALLFEPSDIAISSDGFIYVTEDMGNNIRRIDQQGIITRYAGRYAAQFYWDYNIGNYNGGGFSGDGGPAANADLCYPSSVAVMPNGKVLIADNGNNRIRVIEPMQPGYTDSELTISSDDGSELYLFTINGKHLKTFDALTGITRYEFIYDSSGALTAIRDVDSLVTLIERDSLLKPLGIISPFGQQTTLTLNSGGYISAIKNPANNITQFTYTPDGLMQSMRDAKSNLHQFVYDTLGRLIFDQDPVGGFKQLDHIQLENGYEVRVTTAEGRSTKYRTENLSTGDMRMSNTNDAGLSTVTLNGIDGTSTTTSPDGTVSISVSKPDPRYGMQAPLSTDTTRLPSGLTTTTSQTRTISQMSGSTVTGMIDSVVVNGRAYVSMYDGEQKMFTSISPEGRQSFSWINEKGRVIKDSIPGIESTMYNYDSQGRLVTISQAGRTATYTYDAKSFLATATDPIQRISRFEYDSVGRITRQVLPDLHEILYSYDANGNLTTLTPPTKPAHGFDYNKVDLTTQYAPPILGMDTLNTRYEYNKDKQILRMIRPDGGVVEMIYDSVGCSTCGSPVSRPKKILFDRGELDFKYSQFTGTLDTLISPTDTLSYTYDGSLPKSVTWSGEVNGTVSVEYDNNMRVTSQSINSGNTVGFTYDNDGLLTQSGDMSVAREAETGRISGTALGNVTTSQSYNTLGELAGYTAQYGGNPIFETSYDRDSLGRISDLTERMQGITKAMHYEYDLAGRLESVWRNDTLVSTYSYDANGNRVSRSTASLTDSGSYDAQDRMLTYGNASYVYTRNGELKEKIEGSDTTRYSYDYFGNLVNVVLPNGDRIDYIIDGQNRRIGKKLNGQIVKRWIYSGQLSPVAELDSANNVTAQFIGNLINKNGNTYQIIRDHLGSVKLVVDVNTGTVTQRLDYDEYGNVTQNTNPDFQPFAYAGGLYDTQTKLVRFGARDYDARVGRWTCKDPIGFAGNFSNLFEYVDNNPINNIDQNGLQWANILAGSKPWYFRGLGRLAPSQRWVPKNIPKECLPRYIEPKNMPRPPIQWDKTPDGELMDNLGHGLWEHFHMGGVAGVIDKTGVAGVTSDPYNNAPAQTPESGYDPNTGYYRL